MQVGYRQTCIENLKNTLGDINCVRWNSNGDMLATASDDKTVKLLNFKTGKIIHVAKISEGSKL